MRPKRRTPSHRSNTLNSAANTFARGTACPRRARFPHLHQPIRILQRGMKTYKQSFQEIPSSPDGEKDGGCLWQSNAMPQSVACGEACELVGRLSTWSVEPVASLRSATGTRAPPNEPGHPQSPHRYPRRCLWQSLRCHRFPPAVYNRPAFAITSIRITRCGRLGFRRKRHTAIGWRS